MTVDSPVSLLEEPAFVARTPAIANKHANTLLASSVRYALTRTQSHVEYVYIERERDESFTEMVVGCHS